MKLKKGDEIVITAGKDRGKRGKIETVFVKKGRILVPGLNIFKRHLKRQDEKNPGGILDIPRSLPIGNVAFVCPKCHKPTRLGVDRGTNKKERICKKCKQLV